MLRWLTILGITMVGAQTVTEAASAAGQSVVVILDNSGSMNSPMRGGRLRIEAAKEALLTVLDQTADDAEVGVLLLNPINNSRWLIPLGPVEKQSLSAAVSALRADGSTPLGATMKEATDALLARREQEKYGTYKLLIVSDGEATDPQLVERYLPQIQARGVLIDVIGVSMAGQHSLATRANTYRSADDPQSLTKAISEVVLGESSNDLGDAGQSDFELIGPLPAEVATAALAALVEQSNAPIGNAETNPRSEVWQPNSPANPQNPPLPGQNPGRRFSISFLVFGAILLILIFKTVASIGRGQ